MNEISKWIKKYVKKNNLECLVVGVSGGIDSAVVSTLCCISGIKTYLISIPIHQKNDQIQRARAHCEWLTKKYENSVFIEIDLSTFFQKFSSLFDVEFISDLSLANSRSRLRMTTLYQISGSKRGIVVGTGNKIEDFGVGFFTKYGDGGVDISPIADFTKTEVRNLGIELGISSDIINARPTDGLWDDDRCDEDQIGASYEELEWAMEFKDDSNEISERQKKVLEIYTKLNGLNQHKMKKIPIYRKNDGRRSK